MNRKKSECKRELVKWHKKDKLYNKIAQTSTDKCTACHKNTN